MIRNMKFMFVSADKYSSRDDKEMIEYLTGQKCRFGYYWWYWCPRISVRLLTKYKIIDFTWLRFALSFEG